MPTCGECEYWEPCTKQRWKDRPECPARTAQRKGEEEIESLKDLNAEYYSKIDILTTQLSQKEETIKKSRGGLRETVKVLKKTYTFLHSEWPDTAMKVKEEITKIDKLLEVLNIA